MSGIAITRLDLYKRDVDPVVCALRLPVTTRVLITWPDIKSS